MADFQPAVTITLQHEGGFFHNTVTGEIVNHGVTLQFVQSSGYKPDADESFIQNLSVAEASADLPNLFLGSLSHRLHQRSGVGEQSVRSDGEHGSGGTESCGRH